MGNILNICLCLTGRRVNSKGPQSDKTGKWHVTSGRRFEGKWSVKQMTSLVHAVIWCDKKNERGGIRNEKLRKRIRTAQTAQSSSDLMRVVPDKSGSVFHTVKKAIKSKKNVLPIFHGCDWKRPRWHVECLICIEDESRMQLSSLSDWLSELSCSDYCGFKKALLPR